MEWYPWLNKVYVQILRAYRSGNGHHFLLIQSKNNNGEDELIFALVRWLMCSKSVGIKSCDQCYNCCLLMSNCHPDYYLLGLDEGVQSIGVEKVRMLSEKLYQYAYVSKLKIVYIKNSESLTEEAINSLLKIFEEPPDQVYFFLKCKDFTRLLPTFLSRCLRWTIHSPVESVGLQWLHKKDIVVNHVQILAALRLSSGAPLEAYSILKSDYWGLRFELCKKLKIVISDNNFLSILPLLKRGGEEDRTLVHWLCSFLIDALKWKYGVYDVLVNVDQIDLVQGIASKYSSLVLNHQLQQWLICLFYWENVSHINQKLLLVYQLLNIEGNVIHFS